MAVCLLCKEGGTSSKPLAKLRTKGLNSLKILSRQLGDGKVTRETTLPAFTHVCCRRDYTHPSKIAIKLKKQQLQESQSITSIDTRSQQNSAFGYPSHRLFCGEIVSVNSKLPEHRREKVSRVQTLPTEKIKAIARQRNYGFSLAVLGRNEFFLRAKFFLPYEHSEDNLRSQAFLRLC